MLLKDILSEIEYSGVCPESEITDIVYDSRKVRAGCVFVCLRGASSDGHLYAAEAAKKGAAAIVAQEPVTAEVPVLLVADTRCALAKMSVAFFGYPAKRMKTVGITGTKGKTTTSFMIRSILESAGYRVGLIGTIGILIGEEITPTDNTTPESYEVQRAMKKMADAHCDFCVMEVSSIGLKANRVAGIEFDVGLFTNFSADHIGGAEHRDMAEYLYCKSLLFRQCKIGVLNLDDEHMDGILEGHTCEVTTYGFSAQAELRASGESLISRPGYLGAHFCFEGLLSFPVNVDIPGRFSVYNALAATAVCRLFGVSQNAVVCGLDTVKVKGRVEPVAVSGKYTLLIDYAHNAVSMQNILETLREYHPNRLICMFGAGGNRPKIRRFEMGETSGRLSDLSVITEDNSRFENVSDIIEDIKVGIEKTGGAYIVIPNRTDAIRWCMENAQSGDIVVLAGKGHEDYQEIKGEKHHYDEREVIAQILSEQKEKRV